MTDTAETTDVTASEFVLVAGACLGSWAWGEVVPGLREAGHGVHPLTLSGLADKQGLPVGKQAHVQDIVAEVERLDLWNVVLVGHSYSGVPVGQAAERIGDRLARVVFVDSDVPVHGEAFVPSAPDPRRAPLLKSIEENGGFWHALTASELADQDLTDEQIARILDGATPHPGVSLTEPAELQGWLGALPATYVKCLLDGAEPSDDVAKLLESERWDLVRMNTGHWPMFSQPQELVAVLHAAAARK
ncbi:alpha/beta fold hydrolase [Streptomyces sp. NPDC054863]